jgi:hypothetical protein
MEEFVLKQDLFQEDVCGNGEYVETTEFENHKRIDELRRKEEVVHVFVLDGLMYLRCLNIPSLQRTKVSEWIQQECW